MTISNKPSFSDSDRLTVPPKSTSPEVTVPPHSALEQALIRIVLPHTPYLLIPLHPQRFLAQLTLPINDPGRPHPALLYILYAQAVKVLEIKIPANPLPPPPLRLFPQSFTPPMPRATVDDTWVLDHVRGMSENFLERARVELDHGIRNVDRMYDLVRASVGIARHLISLGRFIEGYTMPMARLLVACGLHRQTGNIVPPDGGPLELPTDMPKPFASPYHHRHSNSDTANERSGQYPVLRMRPVVLPPPRDEIESAERVMTFWAVKYEEWEMSVGWGWSVSLADDECTTMWPWGWGSPEVSHRASSVLKLKRLRLMSYPDPPARTCFATFHHTRPLRSTKPDARLHIPRYDLHSSDKIRRPPTSCKPPVRSPRRLDSRAAHSSLDAYPALGRCSIGSNCSETIPRFYPSALPGPIPCTRPAVRKGWRYV